MTTETHKHPNYMAIFGALIGLTVVELAVAQLPRFVTGSTRIMIVALVALALVKAMLVALYFMHLRFEKKTFVILVSFPLVLAVILIIALLPDVAGFGH
jgi:cytochrome c oxidase subunit IV